MAGRALSLATLLVAMLATVPALAAGKLVGGPCAYVDHPGTATIVSVETRPPRTAGAPAPPYQPHAVLFTYTPAPGSPVEAQALAGKAHRLTLTGGADPGPAFLKKYGIRAGVGFPCVLRLIRMGTCSPVVFTFQGIDLSDHFESTASGR